MNCSDIVVRGENRAALPALLIASYLPVATALVGDLESVAGESDPASMSRLGELSGFGRGGTDELLRRYGDRLDLRQIVRASGSGLKVVLTSISDQQTPWYLSTFDAAGCDVVVHPESADYWLQTTA